VASRIAALAQGGEVLTSAETVGQIEDADVRFERVGPVELKGVAKPLILYRAKRQEP
jgi:class 3 adenylate cyclase